MVTITEKTLKMVAIAGVPLGIFAFLYLNSIGLITITGYTPDQTCIGSKISPCYVYINFTANKDFTLGKMKNPLWMFETKPYIHSIRMYRSLNNGAYREFNLSKSSASFSKGKNYSIKYVILKDANQTLKWSFGEIDPYIFAVNKDTVFTKLISSYADMNYGEAIFELSNPYSNNVISADELKFKFTGSDYIDYQVYIENKSEHYIPQYSYNIVYHNVTVKDNITLNDINESQGYTQQTKIGDLKQFDTKWVILKEIPTGKHNIKLIINWKPRTKTNIDWIPEITLKKSKSGLDKDEKIEKSEWAWMNSSWKYERDIAVTMWENATDYQILLNMNLSNEKIAGKLNSDYTDLRFTNNNDSNLIVLPHWVVNNSKDNYSYIRVWVKGNFTTNNNTQLRMYYGNPSAINSSNIYSTAIFGDDFNGATLNTTAWNTTDLTSNGQINQSDGYVGLWKTGTDTNYLYLFSSKLQSTPIIIEGRYALQVNSVQNAVERYAYKIARLNNTANATSHDNTWQNRAEYGLYHGTSSNTSIHDPEGYNLTNTTPLESSSIVFHELSHQYASGNIKLKVDNSSIVFNSSNYNETKFNYSSATVGFYMMSWYNPIHYLYIDYVFARKYLKQEPTYSLGSETTNNISFTLNGQNNTRKYELGSNITLNITADTDVTLYLNEKYHSLINMTNYDNRIYNESGWTKDNSIINDIDNISAASAVTVFDMYGVTYIISGLANGTFAGFNYTNISWQSDSNIISGLADYGDNSTPTVFLKNGTYYLIQGIGSGELYGYNWTGTTWRNDTNIVSGLADAGFLSTPCVFKYNNNYYIIVGKSSGSTDGYNWSGTAWQDDSAIDNGFTGLGTTSAPTLLTISNTLYSIFGQADGKFYGFKYNGTQWVSNTTISAGLGDIGSFSAPSAFNIFNSWYLISGSETGYFHGFNRYITTTSVQKNITSEVFNYTNYNTTQNTIYNYSYSQYDEKLYGEADISTNGSIQDLQFNENKLYGYLNGVTGTINNSYLANTTINFNIPGQKATTINITPDSTFTTQNWSIAGSTTTESQTLFENGNSTQNISYPSGGNSQTIYLNIPRYSTITNATLTISGTNSSYYSERLITKNGWTSEVYDQYLPPNLFYDNGLGLSVWNYEATLSGYWRKQYSYLQGENLTNYDRNLIKRADLILNQKTYNRNSDYKNTTLWSVTSDSWSEGSISYTSRPSMISLLATLNGSKSTFEIDISSYYISEAITSLGLEIPVSYMGYNNGHSFYERTNSENYSHIHEYHYPSTVTFEVGDNGITNFTKAIVNNTAVYYLNITSIQNYIDTQCSTDICSVPINITSATDGQVQLSGHNTTYSNSPFNVRVDVDGSAAYVGSGSLTTAVNFTSNINTANKSVVAVAIYNDRSGNVSINSTLIYTIGRINTSYVDYFNISAKAWNGNKATSNVWMHKNGNGNVTVKINNSAKTAEHIAQMYWSNYSVNLPTGIDFIEFIPKSPTAKNVTPYGQTDNKSLLNITYLQNPAHNFTWYFLQNDTNNMSCINTTVSNTKNKTDGYITNGTWTSYATNKNNSYNFGLWFWVDFACNYTTWKLYEPTYYFRGCCESCICDDSIA